MGLYYNLPVYKASYGLVQILFLETKKFAREYKYTVGQQLKNDALALVKDVYRANKAIDKIVDIENARENVEMIRLQLRLVQDLGQISLERFVKLNLYVEEVSTQLVLWEKYNKSKVEIVKTAGIVYCQGIEECAEQIQ